MKSTAHPRKPSQLPPSHQSNGTRKPQLCRSFPPVRNVDERAAEDDRPPPSNAGTRLHFRQQDKEHVRRLTGEIKSLIRRVPNLLLRGSIPQTLRHPFSARIPRDIDFLLIAPRPLHLPSVLGFLLDTVISQHQSYPILFTSRAAISVDVRTRLELTRSVGWYEWSLCRTDAITIGLPFDITRERACPTLDDLLDYMEYVTYLGARPYARSRRPVAHETAMNHKLRQFLHRTSQNPPATLRLPPVHSGDPILAFAAVIHAMFRVRTRTPDQNYRLANLTRWVDYWRAQRSNRNRFRLALNPRTEQDLMRWRIRGKPWVARDMESRLVWADLIAATQQPSFPGISQLS